jgi:DnaJ-domain-containing protein 1
MNKLKVFLISDGVFVAGGILLFLLFFFRSRRQSQFRDDLWTEKKRRETEARQQAFEDQADKKILLEHRSDPKDPEEPAGPRAKPEFWIPNFRGEPHEILGVSVIANRDTILRAYKHWIKRYHPDRVSHLGPKYVEQARRRAEQLNSARDQLLKALGGKA